ncbi:MAG TPA: hypothetical protein H9895_11490 [Candidatus Pseudogracilibacillus intestinigallinarum]|uniref:Uncharacterized protein n=1 Tax=Candidatus Pseudogracilibacillus intestinigallinarum TaxID=2838742 RepID=A0A9D1TLR7_9BACI|nr:hypothetical protein [Candidatus Pseudogracilibacillus intestinigallinarum]
MEMLLDFLKDILKVIIRAISAYVFHKILFKNEKTTRSRRKRKGGSQK